MAFAGAALGAIGPILAVASTVTSLIGTALSVRAARQQAAAEAQAAERNKEIQLRNAKHALDVAQSDQLRQDQTARGLIAQQIAEQSASGLRLESGSFMLTRKSARQLARQDAAAVREAGDIDAANFRMLAEDAGFQAQFAHQRGQNALLAGFIEGAGTIIGGAQSFIKPSGSLLGGTKQRPYEQLA